MTDTDKTKNQRGAIVKIDDVMLTNIPTGKRKPPPGQPWAAYLHVTRGKRPANRRRCIVELSGKTKAARDRKVAAFVRAAGVEPTLERRR